MARTMLFLEIDGVLVPGHPERSDFVDFTAAHGVWLSPTMAQSINRLGMEKWWLTSHGEEANNVIAPLLGWSTLPVAPKDENASGWWKLEALLRVVRSDDIVVWVDSSLSERSLEAQLALEDYRVKHLLVPTNANSGLTLAQLSEMWTFVVPARLGYTPGDPLNGWDD